jgi:hypothetical protein
MRAAGRDANQRPKLAIARAHWQDCWFFFAGGSPRFAFERNHGVYRRAIAGGKIDLTETAFGPPLAPDLRSRMMLRAPVPHIPPAFRPQRELSKYLILWEAEWQEVPHDPILLSPIGADLYLVCAQWDLTPLERSILFAKV